MHILRKVAAILTGVAALIGGASIAAGANAADSTPFTTDELAKDQSITVQATASDANLAGSTFKAVPLAYYSWGKYAGTGDNAQIISYDLKDTGITGLKDAINDALTNSGNTLSAVDKANPMAWVAQHLNQSQPESVSSTDYPWSGKLRDFLDQLKNQSAFQNATTTGTLLTVASDHKSASASVRPGIYAIVDTTNDTTNNKHTTAAIIALNGTGINGITKLANSKDASNWILGTVEYKANTNHGDVTTVKKKIMAMGKHVLLHGFYANAAIGSTVTYQITSTVPNWTGYHDFRYQIVDTPDDALTFNQTPVVVKVNDTELKNSDTATYYTVSQDPTSKAVTFKFGDKNGNIVADKANFPVGATVTVTYTMTVNKNATSGGSYVYGIPNKAQVFFSHNPNNSGDLLGGKATEADVYTGHVNVLKTDMNNEPLVGAKFNLLDSENNKKVVNVVKTGDGKYRLADATETGDTVTTNLTTDSNGIISIDGLNGTYELKETTSPLGSPVLADATFTVDGSTVTSVTEANNLAHIDTANTTNGDQIDVLNARNLLEMPKTGAAGILMNVIIALLLIAAGVTALLVHRHNVKKAASAK